MLWKHLDAANGDALLREVEGLGKAEVEALLVRRGHASAAKLAPQLRPIVVRQDPHMSVGAPTQGSLLAAPAMRFAPPAAALGPSGGEKALGFSATRACSESAGAGAQPRAADDGCCAEARTTAPVLKTSAVCLYKLQVTLTAESKAALQQSQRLLRHRLPHGDYNDIVALALRELVAKLECDKACALKKAPLAAQGGVAVTNAGLQSCRSPSSDSSGFAAKLERDKACGLTKSVPPIAQAGVPVTTAGLRSCRFPCSNNGRVAETHLGVITAVLRSSADVGSYKGKVGEARDLDVTGAVLQNLRAVGSDNGAHEKVELRVSTAKQQSSMP